MQVFHQDVDRAIKNGSNRCTYSSKISPEQAVMWLVNGTAPRAQHAARSLIRQMASQRWFTMVGPHIEGSVDKSPHITVNVGRPYHLRLDAQGKIFDITTHIANATARAGGKPWAPPGAPNN